MSNNGARNRFIIRKKASTCGTSSIARHPPVSPHSTEPYNPRPQGLEGQIDIVTPQTIGGLKSPEYLALNPQGKMPLLVTESGWPLPESEVWGRLCGSSVGCMCVDEESN